MFLKKNRVIDILKITEDISHIKDIDSLLDRVLLEARNFTNADAGSIYLIKDLAKVSGCSTHTLKFYLRLGILKEIGRSPETNFQDANRI